MQNCWHLLVAFLVATLIGCSTFDRDWKTAANQPTNDIEGRWIGRWHSQTNGHNDVLRCLITKKADNLYETHFHAKYKLCSFFPVSFGYALDMTVTRDNGKRKFKGQTDRGSLAGGVYHYTGQGDTNQLHFNYRASKDHGTFKLQRPEQDK